MIAVFVLLVATSELGIQGNTLETVSAQEQQKNAKRQKQSNVASLTGCIDQQAGQYVLVDDHGLNRIADLEAEGFPTEGFAKHVGHKVTVRGTSSADGKPVFKVRTIETISETCTPQDE